MQSNRITLAEYKAQRAGGGNNPFSHIKNGWWDNGAGKRYYMRSKWERNIAAYLEFLIAHKQITDWQYEVDTFWFDGIRRGTNSYKPDFKVFNLNGSIEYWEVKGHMDSKSATKLKRMAKYHPTVKMVLIDGEQYKAFKKYSGLMPGWED